MAAFCSSSLPELTSSLLFARCISDSYIYEQHCSCCQCDNTKHYLAEAIKPKTAQRYNLLLTPGSVPLLLFILWKVCLELIRSGGSNLEFFCSSFLSFHSSRLSASPRSDFCPSYLLHFGSILHSLSIPGDWNMVIVICSAKHCVTDGL